MSKTSIIIFDDHKQFREGLKLLLEETCNAYVVETTNNENVFRQNINNKHIDIVFMNINISDLSRFNTIKNILHDHPDLNIIALSMYGDNEYLRSLMNIRVKGFVVRDIDVSKNEIKEAIDTVLQGKFYFSNVLMNNKVYA